MRRIEWYSLIRALGWVVAITFVIGAIAQLVLSFDLTGPPPGDPNAPLPEGDAFIQQILDFWAWEHGRVPIDLVGTLATGIGFISLGTLGHALTRLTDAEDGRRGIVSVAFIAAGVLGAASQLGWIGVKPVATSTEICQCGFTNEEVVARLMILNVTGSVIFWAINGAAVFLAVGLIPLSRMGREAGMPTAWGWLSILLAALLVVALVVAQFPVFPVDVILTIVITAVVVPAWAIWLALHAPQLLTEDDDEPMEPEPMEVTG